MRVETARRLPGLIVLGLVLSVLGTSAQEFEWETYLNPNRTIGIAYHGGRLWLASVSGGVTVYDISNDTFSTIHRRPGGLASNELTGVLLDWKDRLWFATAASGVSVLDSNDSSWRLLTGFEGLPSDTVTVMSKWGDSVWIGTPSGFAVFKDGLLVGRCNVRLPPDVRCPLESHSIQAIAPADGGAYLGTPAGVSWYDGVQAAELGDSKSLGTIVDLALDDGVLWALATGGAYRWNSDSSEWILEGHTGAGHNRGLSVVKGTLHAITSSGVYEWSEDAWSRVGGSLDAMGLVASDSGDIWAAASNGLYLLSAGQWIRKEAPGPIFDDFRSIAVGRDGETWFTGPSWVTSFDGETWSPISFNETDYRLQGCDTHGILVDDSNRVWFGHCCSVNLPDSCLVDRLTRSVGSWRWRRFDTTKNIWRVAEGGGSFWLASRFTGLYRIRDGNQEPQQILAGTGMQSNSLSSLVFDPARGLWVGHRQEGVDLFRGAVNGDDGDWVHIGIEEGLLTDSVRKLLIKGGEVWVGTLGGVSVIDPSSMTVVRNYTVGPGGVEDRITGVSGMAVDGEGDVWVSTDGGGVYLIQGDGTVLSFNRRNSPLTNDTARDVAYDRFSEKVWITTFVGVNAVQRSTSPIGGPGASAFVYPNPYCPRGCDGSEGGFLRIGGLEGTVSGEIVDLKGQVVAHFFSVGSGDAIWDGDDESGTSVGSGLYFAVVRSGSETIRVKFALVR